LLDTHLVIWSARDSHRLSQRARDLITDPGNEIMFSVVSVWEVAIKHALNRADFQIDPAYLRRGLLINRYSELLVNGEHAIAVAMLPRIHRDPFDRLLVGQALVESVTLLTIDPVVARYPCLVQQV
jgi:PIN domain nuclease of toxin-antitoxin system